MSEVFLHVYDVTNSVSVKTNSAIVHLNRLLRDGFGLGGIFHGGIQVYDEEWSFGYCENGSGVFSCPPKENPMYTYRESVALGYTMLSEIGVNQILMDLSREWPGYSYDLLSRNCNHFCDEFCRRLGVQKPPAWVNRFANAGDAAVEVAGSTMERLRQAKSDLVSAGKFALRILFGGNSTVNPSPELLVTSSTSPLIASVPSTLTKNRQLNIPTGRIDYIESRQELNTYGGFRDESPRAAYVSSHANRHVADENALSEARDVGEHSSIS